MTVMVASLAPRKMRFGLSEGMILAASDPDAKRLAVVFAASPLFMRGRPFLIRPVFSVGWMMATLFVAAFSASVMRKN
jgi:tRNA-binding EMAP/Myf-like protein